MSTNTHTIIIIIIGFWADSQCNEKKIIEDEIDRLKKNSLLLIFYCARSSESNKIIINIKEAKKKNKALIWNHSEKNKNEIRLAVVKKILFFFYSVNFHPWNWGQLWRLFNMRDAQNHHHRSSQARDHSQLIIFALHHWPHLGDFIFFLWTDKIESLRVNLL